MIKIKVNPGAVFEAGQGALVELDEQQAAARRHRLEPGSANVYRVASNVQFKGGEVLRIDAVEKGQAHLVEVIEPAEPEPASETGADTMKQSRNDDEHGFNTPKRGRPPLGNKR